MAVESQVVSAQVFVDGGWIGLKLGVSHDHKIQSLTPADALRLAADLVQAAVGDQITSRLCGEEVPLFDALRFAAPMAEHRMPVTPNGTEFERVGS